MREITRKPDYYLDEEEFVKIDNYKKSDKGLAPGETGDIYAKYAYMRDRNRQKEE